MNSFNQQPLSDLVGKHNCPLGRKDRIMKNPFPALWASTRKIAGAYWDKGERTLIAVILFALMVLSFILWKIEVGRYLPAILFLTFGGLLIQGLRNIPAKPPHKGVATKWGRRIPVFYDEGWGFYPFYPFWFGFIVIKTERISFDIIFEKARTPDRAESKVPVFITGRAIPQLGIQYLDSGGEEGIKIQLTGKIQERIREWASGAEEGPTDWVELNQSHLEAVSVLVRQIAGKNPLPPGVPGEVLAHIQPAEAQKVPTWIWLRYFAQPRPTKWLKNEKLWAENNWEKVMEVLREIKAKYGNAGLQQLKKGVDARRRSIEALRTGSGQIVLADLGFMLERLNLGDIQQLGKVGEQAEEEAKEEQQRLSQTKELDHVSERIQALMKVERPDGTRLTREQAVELVELSTKRATKTIEGKVFGFDPTAAKVVGEILSGIAGRRQP